MNLKCVPGRVILAKIRGEAKYACIYLHSVSVHWPTIPRGSAPLNHPLNEALVSLTTMYVRMYIC